LKLTQDGKLVPSILESPNTEKFHTVVKDVDKVAEGEPAIEALRNIDRYESYRPVNYPFASLSVADANKLISRAGMDVNVHAYTDNSAVKNYCNGVSNMKLVDGEISLPPATKSAFLMMYANENPAQGNVFTNAQQSASAFHSSRLLSMGKEETIMTGAAQYVKDNDEMFKAYAQTREGESTAWSKFTSNYYRKMDFFKGISLFWEFFKMAGRKLVWPFLKTTFVYSYGWILILIPAAALITTCLRVWLTKSEQRGPRPTPKWVLFNEILKETTIMLGFRYVWSMCIVFFGLYLFDLIEDAPAWFVNFSTLSWTNFAKVSFTTLVIALAVVLIIKYDLHVKIIYFSVTLTGKFAVWLRAFRKLRWLESYILLPFP